MRRAAIIVLGIGIAVVASGNPRPSERPRATTEAPLIHSDSRSQFLPGMSTTFQDTIFFGGTTWAPDSARWEALRDSVWTFETGVGSWINTGQLPGKPLGFHGGMEGWSGFNPWGLGKFERSHTCAISGAYSLWAGVDSATTTAAPRCYVAGQGYGDDWWVTRIKSFFYPGSGTVTLSYDYAVESESGYDEAFVDVDVLDEYLASYSGQVSGHETITLSSANGTLPDTAATIVIRFTVYSDGSGSDEDGQFPTVCGHTVIDNIRLTGAITDFSDFESDENDWVPGPESVPGYGDLSHLAAISSLPPMQVPGPCGVEDSVLVFHDTSFRIPWGWNLALSPWIDLKRNNAMERPGKLVTFDMYSEYFWWPNGDNQLVSMVARWYPASSCGGFKGIYLHMFDMGKWCSSGNAVVVDVSSYIPADAEQVQFGIGVLQYTGLFSQSTDTPWLDNLRFGVYGVPTSGVPEVPEPPITALIGAEPNPLHSSTRINFMISSDRHVLLEVFDVAGRLVRTLVNSPLPAGPNTAMWDARDDSGQRVSTGLYFYRLTAGNVTAASKLIVLR